MQGVYRFIFVTDSQQFQLGESRMTKIGVEEGICPLESLLLAGNGGGDMSTGVTVTSR